FFMMQHATVKLLPVRAAQHFVSSGHPSHDATYQKTRARDWIRIEEYKRNPTSSLLVPPGMGAGNLESEDHHPNLIRACEVAWSFPPHTTPQKLRGQFEQLMSAKEGRAGVLC